MILNRIATPTELLTPDPDRIREIADWLEQSGMPQMAAAARQAARELDAAAPQAEDRREADRPVDGPAPLYRPSRSSQDDPEFVRPVFLSLGVRNLNSQPLWNGRDDPPEV